MSNDSRDAACASRATLDAWRERGADRLNPVRFRFIEALARRASTHAGEARRVLDARLSQLVAGYAADLANASRTDARAHGAEATTQRAGMACGALGSLADDMTREAQTRGAASAYPELKELDYFREVWSRLSTERQLRQSLQQVPGNAGPLNSSSLVHRSLSLMRELSPGYLQQFLSYVDTLSWLEQMHGGSAPAAKDAPRPTSVKKSTRSKSR
ncbi:MAG TPA: DUF2894 domain-containing protein [Paraburkholderia sp.]|nr:DUF2894 domain-containing protein [Paraburkholderia sp.]